MGEREVGAKIRYRGRCKAVGMWVVGCWVGCILGIYLKPDGLTDGVVSTSISSDHFQETRQTQAFSGWSRGAY
jgi:hypothetical protein